jgi:hypothetical protein
VPDLFDNVVSENKIYRGAGRVVYAPVTQAFPTQISDVMDKTTYTLTAGWTDIGGTTDDGVKVGRGVKVFDGVTVDQLRTPVLLGEIDEWTGAVEMTLLHTDAVTLQTIWEGATLTVVGNEQVVDFGSPSQLTERRIAIIQRHSKTGALRMFCIRRAKIDATDYEVMLQASDPSATPWNLLMLPDTDVAVDQNMFTVYEEIPAP